MFCLDCTGFNCRGGSIVYWSAKDHAICYLTAWKRINVAISFLLSPHPCLITILQTVRTGSLLVKNKGLLKGLKIHRNVPLCLPLSPSVILLSALYDHLIFLKSGVRGFAVRNASKNAALKVKTTFWWSQESDSKKLHFFAPLFILPPGDSSDLSRLEACRCLLCKSVCYEVETDPPQRGSLDFLLIPLVLKGNQLGKISFPFVDAKARYPKPEDPCFFLLERKGCFERICAGTGQTENLLSIHSYMHLMIFSSQNKQFALAYGQPFSFQEMDKIPPHFEDGCSALFRSLCVTSGKSSLSKEQKKYESIHSKPLNLI